MDLSIASKALDLIGKLWKVTRELSTNPKLLAETGFHVLVQQFFSG